jgi:ABC-2 type transport system permease protein
MSGVLRRQLADRRRVLATWALAVAAVGLFYMLLWPSIDDTLAKTVQSYPEALRQAFGITALSTPEQFLNTELFSLMLPLVLGVFAGRRIAATITGAQEHGYLDVLLSAPISRRALAATALAETAIEVAVILGIGVVGTVIGALIAGVHLDAGRMVAGYANLWPLAMFTAGVAMLVTGISRHASVVTGVSSGVLVAMYIADLLGRLTGGDEWLRHLSVFRYYGSAAVDGLDPLDVAGVTLAAVALAVAGTILFERRDL